MSKALVNKLAKVRAEIALLKVAEKKIETALITAANFDSMTFFGTATVATVVPQHERASVKYEAMVRDVLGDAKVDSLAEAYTKVSKVSAAVKLSTLVK
jgi:hypothetical protein